MQDRRNAIKEYIVKNDEASIDKLMELFPGFSAMTIRRDLDYLEETGFVIRTHGGARFNRAFTAREDLYAMREIENSAAKEAIARKTVALIDPSRAVYIDSGTTCMALARILPETDAPVLTNGVNIAAEISLKNRCTPVSLLGGAVSPISLAVSGSMSLKHLAGLNIDTAVMSASGFSPEAGFSNGNIQECELKKAVVAKARLVIMMIDDSKFFKNLPYTFARETDIKHLVSNTRPPDEIVCRLADAGAQLIY